MNFSTWIPGLLLMALLALQTEAQQRQNRGQARKPDAEQMLKRLKLMDRNKDGKIARSEARGPVQQMFSRLDDNKDGMLNEVELKAFVERRTSGNGQRQASGKRRDGDLEVGEMAPGFKLKTVDGKREVQLSYFRSKKPVVLIFGSCT